MAVGEVTPGQLLQSCPDEGCHRLGRVRESGWLIYLLRSLPVSVLKHAQGSSPGVGIGVLGRAEVPPTPAARAAHGAPGPPAGFDSNQAPFGEARPEGSESGESTRPMVTTRFRLLRVPPYANLVHFVAASDKRQRIVGLSSIPGSFCIEDGTTAWRRSNARVRLGSPVRARETHFRPMPARRSRKSPMRVAAGLPRSLGLAVPPSCIGWCLRPYSAAPRTRKPGPPRT